MAHLNLDPAGKLYWSVACASHRCYALTYMAFLLENKTFRYLWLSCKTCFEWNAKTFILSNKFASPIFGERQFVLLYCLLFELQLIVTNITWKIAQVIIALPLCPCNMDIYATSVAGGSGCNFAASLSRSKSISA